MVIQLPLTLLMHLVKLLQSIQLHHLLQWQNMLKNGLQKVRRTSLAHQSMSLKCSQKLVLKVLFMVTSPSSSAVARVTGLKVEPGS